MEDLIVLGVEDGGGGVGEHQLEAADKLGPLASSTQSLGTNIAIFWDIFFITYFWSLLRASDVDPH